MSHETVFYKLTENVQLTYFQTLLAYKYNECLSPLDFIPVKTAKDSASYIWEAKRRSCIF